MLTVQRRKIVLTREVWWLDHNHAHGATTENRPHVTMMWWLDYTVQNTYAYTTVTRVTTAPKINLVHSVLIWGGLLGGLWVNLGGLQKWNSRTWLVFYFGSRLWVPHNPRWNLPCSLSWVWLWGGTESFRIDYGRLEEVIGFCMGGRVGPTFFHPKNLAIDQKMDFSSLPIFIFQTDPSLGSDYHNVSKRQSY